MVKKYLKYGLLIIGAFALIGLLFYLLNKPKDFVLKNIPSDVTYCFTINKKEFFKEKSYFEAYEKDTFFKNVKGKIPMEAIEIIEKIGINPFGDIAVFGQQNNEINLAWVGKNKVELLNLIKQKHWVETKTEHFNQIKINDKLFLKYKWPIVELSANNTYNDFFNPKSKKLSEKDLEHPKTKGSLLYGFILADRDFIINYPFIPLYGKAYFGLKKDNKKIRIVYIQRRIKLKGKLGIPQKLPQSNALISWPLDIGQIPQVKQVPSVVLSNLNKFIKNPVKHMYAELLDTISTYQEIIQYDMNEEFQLTQNIINQYTTFPGLRLQFIKTNAENNLVTNEIAKSTNLGLDIFRLNFKNTSNSYCIYSENILPQASTLNLPDYFIYANVEQLKYDPYWSILAKTNVKTLQLHAENYEKGSMFVININLK